MSKKITFTGGFGEYFIMSLGLLLLSVITLGIALPYWVYWSFKYFFTKLEIDGKKVVFIGGFGEYFVMSLGLLFAISNHVWFSFSILDLLVIQIFLYKNGSSRIKGP